MQQTWEIRWFGEGAVPLKLQQWSEEIGFIMQPVRSDLYLIHSGGKNIGIKWREGNLQIKELVKKTGSYEQYQKWSFDLSDNRMDDKLDKYEKWQSVTKKREMAKWRIKNSEFTRVEIDEVITGSCEVELSALVLSGHLWWTVAYEATGEKENLEKTLNKFTPPLSKDVLCMGYAEWINRNFSKNGF
ncbi:MAG: hypothetical protein ACNS60_12525 [Candidatus Cyclobacteriaceae bacterium M2_1C_046]